MKRSRARSPEDIEYARAERATANEFASIVWQWVRNRQIGNEKFRREVPIPPYNGKQTMSSPLVRELERRLLPQLNAMASQLRSEFPHIRVNTWSSTIGSATTDNPAHCMGIDCVFLDAPADEADNVALYVELLQISSNPYLSDLSVAWGAGASEDCIKADYIDSPVPWSEDSFARIDSALPDLFEVLVKALRNPPFPSSAA